MGVAVVGHAPHELWKSRTTGARQIRMGETNDTWIDVNPAQERAFDQLYSECRKRNPDTGKCDVLFMEILANARASIDSVSKEDKVGILNNLMKWFSEYLFEPNFRFVNTLCFMRSQGRQNEYVSGYFELTDSPYSSSIVEKMKSMEWSEIMDQLDGTVPSKKINTRLKIYYGPQGTGKTTAALRETNDLCIVCHSAVLPQDLMEDFSFNDGKAQFTPSKFYKAMTNGYGITLDEINLLPYDTQRFLQSVLDGKKEFIYKGQTVKIKDGFYVIGTMNLVVNGSTYPLPDPLVDRASDIQKFALTAESLVNCIL